MNFRSGCLTVGGQPPSVGGQPPSPVVPVGCADTAGGASPEGPWGGGGGGTGGWTWRTRERCMADTSFVLRVALVARLGTCQRLAGAAGRLRDHSGTSGSCMHDQHAICNGLGMGKPIGPCSTHPFTVGLVWLLGGATLMLLLSTPISSWGGGGGGEGTLGYADCGMVSPGFSRERSSQHLRVGYS